jgi:hypothetical protein
MGHGKEGWSFCPSFSLGEAYHLTRKTLTCSSSEPRLKNKEVIRMTNSDSTTLKKSPRTNRRGDLFCSSRSLWASLAYDQIQFRIAEFLVLLCFWRPDFVIGVTIGCFLSQHRLAVRLVRHMFSGLWRPSSRPCSWLTPRPGSSRDLSDRGQCLHRGVGALDRLRDPILGRRDVGRDRRSDRHLYFLHPLDGPFAQQRLHARPRPDAASRGSPLVSFALWGFKP